MPVRSRTAERYARALAAGLVAVAALLLAANAAPVDATPGTTPAPASDTVPAPDDLAAATR
ncbi:hypothetical protein ABZT26_17515 [Streptomyces sp. NPDC005395]|uniref:Uncharacterized protein n=1 Tax=Streptomyces salinarius TaxID=2762598 RepID=A0ABW8B936_9ACTN|nr:MULTISPECIES: hypothetical protein [unclassified Streptomyces]NDZ75828.1 hypothetical protein [Streptomyces sp. SID10362]QUW92525.1 hypothetical protein KE639_03762 [Streptomyces sp. V17-9]WKX19889.1 hypothetical protein Q3Y68_18290 [Streptomyces sp. HUAS CX7]